MAKKYRSSLERHNAPYRGTTRREDLVNFDLSVIHDLIEIEKVSGGNSLFKGHKQKVNENFSTLYHNEGEITASIPTAGKLVKEIKKIIPERDWYAKYSSSITKSDDGKTYSLTSRVHQSGMINNIELFPGDILSIRMRVKSNNKNNLKFAIGTTSNNQQIDVDIYNTSDYLSEKYIEKRIYSNINQTIEYGLFGTWGTEGSNSMTIKDIKISLLHEQNTSVRGMDSIIKQELREIEKEIETLQELNDIYKEVF